MIRLESSPPSRFDVGAPVALTGPSRKGPARSFKTAGAANAVEKPASKKRRMIHIGSSPPPFSTILTAEAEAEPVARGPVVQCRVQDRSRHVIPIAPTSPSRRKRRIVLKRRPLNLADASASIPSANLDRTNRSKSHNQERIAEPEQERDEDQDVQDSDGDDPSSPIGTFGALALARSPASGADRPTDLLTGLNRAPSPSTLLRRSRTRSVELRNQDAADKENPAKQQRSHKPPKGSRSRPVQRVQFDRPYVRSADPNARPLGDADHQLNSQDSAHSQRQDEQDTSLDALDLSDISYFPTNTVRDSIRNGKERHGDAAPRVFVDETTVPLLSQSGLCGSPEESQPGPGLLEILSQNALRTQEESVVLATLADQNLDTSLSSESHPEPQIQLEIEFHPAHLTPQAAQSIAGRLCNPSTHGRWRCLSESYIESRCAAWHSPSSSARQKQYFVLPPSKVEICEDLGITPAERCRNHLDDMEEFNHQQGNLYDVHKSEHVVAEFEHRMRFAGYAAPRGSALADAGIKHVLLPGGPSALQDRMTSQQKEVVKLIIPISGAALHRRASQACFVSPSASQPLGGGLEADSRAPTPLIWMQKSATNFVLALEKIVVQSQEEESDSFGPILFYSTEAGTKDRRGQGERSYITLYVHLDRLLEARRILATIAIGDAGKIRPFADPDVGLLVVGCAGEALCII